LGEAERNKGSANNLAEWWDLALPIWGTDSTVAAYDGGYKR